MELRVVKHSEISQRDINTAILLKEQHWKYGVESQFNWMNEHLAPDDLHCFLLTESGEAAAYMNIVTVKAVFDTERISFLGIGNVCVKNELAGRGYATNILKAFFKGRYDKKNPGLLLCKHDLLGFYSKCGWVIQSFVEAYVSGKQYAEFIMTYNFGFDRKSRYIYIDKNF